MVTEKTYKIQFTVVAKLILFTHGINIQKEWLHLYQGYVAGTDTPSLIYCAAYLRQWGKNNEQGIKEFCKD